jgi:hypothetical protein
VARAAPVYRAWVFPSQPSGNESTFDTRSVSGCFATKSSRISAVQSVERSLTAMTSNMPE